MNYKEEVVDFQIKFNKNKKNTFPVGWNDAAVGLFVDILEMFLIME